MKKKHLKLAVVIMIIITLLVPSIVVTGENGDANNTLVSVIIDGEIIPYDDYYGMPFIDENSRTQVPFRLTLETFGAEVSWDNATRTAYAVKGDITLQIPIGESYIIKNGIILENDTSSILKQDRTYLPIRVVMEAFGSEVLWDGETYTVIINTKNKFSWADPLPIYYDLREEGRVTPVKDQDEFGTCWAFAAIGAVESSLAPDGIYDFSEDNISLLHGYSLSQDEGGDWKIALAYFARWSGPVYEVDDKYGDNIAIDNLEASKHIQEAFVIPSKDYDTIKRSIIIYGGVHTSIYIDDTFELVDNIYYNEETSALYYTGDNLANHDVLIIGWDDDYPKENFVQIPEGNGAFICKNSYGTEFGNNGFFYVSYYDRRIGEYNLVYSNIEENDNYDKIYQTDWLGWTGNIGYEEESAYFSNIYETGEVEEMLEAVSFYATDIDTSYEVYVVDEFGDTNDFNERRHIIGGTKLYKGYYTIKFDEPILLGKNTRFAVIVKITTPNSKFPVVVEYYKDSPWLDYVDITDGEGYISLDGKHWDDSEELLQSNISLKAFTSFINE